MRFLIIFISALLLASCGTGKVRFVRTNHFEKQEIVDVDELNRGTTVKDDVRVQKNHEEVLVTPEVSEEQSMDEPDDVFRITDFESAQGIEEFPTVVSDTIRANEISDEEKVDSALRSEKRSIVALISAILFYAFILGVIGYTILFWTVDLIVPILVLSALASLVLSWIFQILARQMRYTTERGRKILLAALILDIISTVALVVAIFSNF